MLSRSPEEKAKLLSDKMIKTFRETSGCDTIVSRYLGDMTLEMLKKGKEVTFDSLVAELELRLTLTRMSKNPEVKIDPIHFTLEAALKLLSGMKGEQQ